jgi:hypothetical protein
LNSDDTSSFSNPSAVSTETAADIFAGDEDAMVLCSEDGGGGKRCSSPFLDWRLDEASSYSDWTITVVTATTGMERHDADAKMSQNDGEQGEESNGLASNDVVDARPPASAAPPPPTKSYSVHKCILAVGPRKSLYFRRVFDHRGFSEHASSTSTLQLEPLAADAFPAMLDYIYGARAYTKLAVDHTTAVPLRFLARYFEIPALHRHLIAYIKNSLSPLNCHVYYAHAAVFCDETVAKAVEALCSTKPSAVCSKNPAIFEVTAPDFWIRVVDRWPYSALRRRGSSVLSQVLKAYRDRIDPDLFRDLTLLCRLPVVRDPVLARTLLDLERSLVNPSLSDGVTSLQDRCVKALAKHQQEKGDAESEKEVTGYLQQQHPVLLGIFLLRILEYERSKNSHHSNRRLGRTSARSATSVPPPYYHRSYPPPPGQWRLMSDDGDLPHLDPVNFPYPVPGPSLRRIRDPDDPNSWSVGSRSISQRALREMWVALGQDNDDIDDDEIDSFFRNFRAWRRRRLGEP